MGVPSLEEVMQHVSWQDRFEVAQVNDESIQTAYAFLRPYLDHPAIDPEYYRGELMSGIWQACRYMAQFIEVFDTLEEGVGELNEMIDNLYRGDRIRATPLHLIINSGIDSREASCIHGDPRNPEHKCDRKYPSQRPDRVPPGQRLRHALSGCR